MGFKSSRDDLAISLKGGRARPIETSSFEVGGHFSGYAEIGIDCSVTEITDRGEVVESCRVIGGADCDDLSIRLDQDRKGIVFVTEKIGCDLAARTKCGV